MENIVILDCYTDEPSGYGVRPFVGTHQINLSQALSYLGFKHFYLTIDDLRYNNTNIYEYGDDTDISILNRTLNCENAINIIENAEIIYIVMGCFVEYNYYSTLPPKDNEVYCYLKSSKAKKILFYVLGSSNVVPPSFLNSNLYKIINHIEFGNTYRFIIENEKTNLIEPNYHLLDQISDCDAQLISQIRQPVIAEIETGAGCNLPYCKFCIESERALKPMYRSPDSIIKQVSRLYKSGVKHFRLGRQPNFYNYQNQNNNEIEKLLYGIRNITFDIKVLHIDNVNFNNVITRKGIETTKLVVKYCTSGNVAPLGIESFDRNVRKAITKRGSPEQALEAIKIINDFGNFYGQNGQPHYLPGINLIYGLTNQTETTHIENLKYLKEILSKNLLTARLFFRKKTNKEGISFSESQEENNHYNLWYNEIIKEFVLPMQSKVYPIGSKLYDFTEIIHKNGDTYLRQLSTNPIRIVVKNNKLAVNKSYNIEVIGNLDNKLLEGKII